MGGVQGRCGRARRGSAGSRQWGLGRVHAPITEAALTELSRRAHPSGSAGLAFEADRVVHGNFVSLRCGPGVASRIHRREPSVSLRGNADSRVSSCAPGSPRICSQTCGLFTRGREVAGVVVVWAPGLEGPAALQAARAWGACGALPRGGARFRLDSAEGRTPHLPSKRGPSWVIHRLESNS